MDLSDPAKATITMVISEVVAPHQISEYEAWTKEINQAAQQFAGFIGVDIIRPRDEQHPEYVVIVKFDSYEHYWNWLNSAEYKYWMQQARKFISRRSHQYQPSGLELWFTLPRQYQKQVTAPAYYKQVIIGVLSVYLLILLSNLVISPWLTWLPDLLALLISVTFVSALISYPVMPYLTKVLGFWLYPSSIPNPPKPSRSSSKKPRLFKRLWKKIQRYM
ncbi:MAG: antibiotic biosynthesis monooxygenase [Pseudanabaenaceae cyanobacterium bins.39]|nr:antibiotic biosynthesis monooxygenase [Pseudanabaenaceae cyanobacterium bins.39]